MHDDRAELRRWLAARVAVGKTEPHCVVCGDVQEQCPLIRTPSGLLCTDCHHIQLHAPDGFFEPNSPLFGKPF
jgi:hypothetical protein